MTKIRLLPLACACGSFVFTLINTMSKPVLFHQVIKESSTFLKTETEWNKSSINWTDPLHTPRLRHFANMSAFPTPSFHGCTLIKRIKGLCHFSNVCFSRRDGILVFDVPELQNQSTKINSRLPKIAAMYEEKWYLPNSNFSNGISIPKKPMLVPPKIYKSLKHVYFAKKMLVMNCWRQTEHKTNPAHMLMGMSNMFVYGKSDISSFQSPNDGPAFDLLLAHQCSTINGWPWGEYVYDLFWKKAVREGTIRPSHGSASMFLSYADDNLSKDDNVVCGEDVYFAPHWAGNYLVNNNFKAIETWENLFEKELPMGVNHTRLCNLRSLRIAIFQRNEGSALRSFQNIDEVKTLAKEYTSREIPIITVNSTTPPDRQVALFQSFDILITPHGSHLSNMIFNKRQSVFIEVACVYFDGVFARNGKSFAKSWINSYGHKPYNNAALVQNMNKCVSKDLNICNKPMRLKFIQSDMVVNTTILRANLIQAVSILCGPVV